jgi:DNA-binding transcriptional LysR family regulator
VSAASPGPAGGSGSRSRRRAPCSRGCGRPSATSCSCTPRGLEPTARAEALAGPVTRALADLRAALDEADFDPARATDSFRVGAVDAVLSVLLGPVGARVMREAPRARLVVRPIDPGQACPLFEARELDLALAPLPQPPAHVGAEDLFAVDFVLATRPGHPLTGGRAAGRGAAGPRVDDLARFPHAVVSFAGSARSPVDDALAAAGLERHVAAVLGSFLAVPHLLAASDAVAIVPGPFARALAAKGLLAWAALPAGLPQPKLVMRLLWPTRLDRSAPHLWLRGVIAEAARALP